MNEKTLNKYYEFIIQFIDVYYQIYNIINKGSIETTPQINIHI